jgi:hypothetical protein
MHLRMIWKWQLNHNVYEQYEVYVKLVEVKQLDDISAEVDDEKNDVISRLIYYGAKPLVSLNDEPAEDDEAGDNEVEECAWVPKELKLVLGYQGTLVSIRLPRSWVSLCTLVSLKLP